MSLKVAILDDEKRACETLQRQFKRIDFDYELIGVFHDPNEALKALKLNIPDLIFLDIEMPGLNGFQFLEKLNLPDVSIIFTTAYDQFALNAFRVNAIDYLLKPVDIAELKVAIKKAIKNKNSYKSELIEKLFVKINQSKSCKIKIGLPSVQGIDFINCNEIIYCQSESNYTRIYLGSERKVLSSKTLKDIEAMLPEALFLRVHHSYIVNLSKVLRFLHDNDGVLVLEDNHNIKVSRSRKRELLERLDTF